MREAVAMALDANLDIKAERLNPDVAAHSVAIAKSAFLPQVQSTLRQELAGVAAVGFHPGRAATSRRGSVSVSGTRQSERGVLRRRVQRDVARQPRHAVGRLPVVQSQHLFIAGPAATRSRCCADFKIDSARVG